MTFFKFLFTKTFLKQIGYAVVVLIGLSIVILTWLRFSTHHGQKIEVPDLSKMNLEEVSQALEELDLKYEIMDTTNYNPEFPYETVIEQIPKAGKFVKENRKIYLSINRSGYPMIEIPMVLGKTLRQAEPSLRAVGFQIGKIRYRKYIAKDELLEMTYEGKKIQPGEKLQKTSVIDLVLGDGKGGLKPEELEAVQNELDGNQNQENSEGEN